jgi:hypothetical protein
MDFPRGWRGLAISDRLEGADDFVGLRVAGVAVFREEECAVALDIEHAASPLRESGFHAQRLLDLGSQTDRPGQVVSGRAVGDDDFHDACSMPDGERPSPLCRLVHRRAERFFRYR